MTYLQYIYLLSKHGFFTIFIFSIELLFVPWLWLVHSIILFYLYYKEERLKSFYVIFIVHLIFVIYIYYNQNSYPKLSNMKITKAQVFLTEDATPNALNRVFVNGYTLWIEQDFLIRSYHKIPVKININYLKNELHRGSIVEISYLNHEFKNNFLYIYTQTSNILLQGFQNPVWYYRSMLIEKIKKLSLEKLQQSTGLYLAVTIGNKNFLSAHNYRLFRNTGLMHLLALSGMHASAIVGIIFFVLKKTYPMLKYSILFLVIILHAWLAGFPYTILRAYLMFIIAVMLHLHYRKAYSLDVLAFSSIIILLIDWRSLYSLSFHLSFLSMFAIILLYKPFYYLFFSIYKYILKNKPNVLSHIIITSLAISFAVESIINPLILFNFNEIQLFSFLSNLLFPPIFIIFIIISSITLFIPSMHFFLHYYYQYMLNILRTLDVYLIILNWKAVLIINLILVISLLFWYNKKQ